MKNISLFSIPSSKFFLFQNEKEPETIAPSENEETERYVQENEGLLQKTEGSQDIITKHNEILQGEIANIAGKKRNTLFNYIQANSGINVSNSIGPENRTTGEAYTTIPVGNTEVYPFLETDNRKGLTNNYNINQTSVGVSKEFGVSDHFTGEAYGLVGRYGDQFDGEKYSELFGGVGVGGTYTSPDENWSLSSDAYLPVSNVSGKYQDNIEVNTALDGTIPETIGNSNTVIHLENRFLQSFKNPYTEWHGYVGQEIGRFTVGGGVSIQEGKTHPNLTVGINF